MNSPVIIITGASRGLGAAAAKIAARLGATVVLNARSVDALEKVAAEIRVAGGQVLALPGDVSQPDVCHQLVSESGIRPLLHCSVVAPILEGNTIKGVITESKMGRKAILAKVVIDASGDADIAHRAGVPCWKMPKDEMMGVTVMFSCAGIKKARFQEYIRANPSTYRDWGKLWNMKTTGKEDDLFSTYLEKPFNLARQAGIIPENIKSIGGTWSTITDAGEATNLNMVYMTGYDCTNVWDLTAAEIEGRKQAMLAIEAMRSFVPGFENAKLRNFGMTLGTRDSRKISSDYSLSGHDVRNQAQFEDSIGIFPEFLDGYGLLVLPTTGRYFQVPYGILVPKNIDNLLVAGRSVGGDKIAHSATRSMMCCTVTGQGAGVAASIAVKTACTPRTTDIKRVQDALIRQQVRLR